ncbi:alanine/glycine:cation symporter family protein [Basilea psittacipulmonis]|uniref:Transporter n=1 Tax=Basilea psittacipulmonis DSM 24701 TaxID=1072685 RepID=A0A077DE47_9BURK|nr:sodium:alanine symporter family protein [Basilea psittacipulmonis]AIL32416.1 transporter [Basilea psittacipulmonis DSM 24701]
MQKVGAIVGEVGDFVWGPYMLALLVGTGILLTYRLGLLQFRMLPYALVQAFKPHKQVNKNGEIEGDVSHFGALMTALSATIGTGNIAGVATAVALGGPGAVFWMWITALVGMATKYGEGVLAVKFRITNSNGEMSGGPMYYIEKGLKLKWLAFLFAFFAVFASFGIGSSVQSNSVADAVFHSFNINPIYTGIALTVLTGIVVLGGIRSIAKASSIIVPIMAIGYVLGGIAIILSNVDILGTALGIIISDAFSAKAIVGGTFGMVIRYGIARGVFSNEAGMGSAPIAAAAAKTDHPVRQALVSMTGTFLDTIIVCSITGIVLVMGMIHMGMLDPNTGVYLVSNIKGGASLTASAFDHLLPGFGGMLIAIGMIFFAYSTILGWCYYGEKCAAYLFSDKFVPFYRVVYVITVFLGCLAVQTGDASDQSGVKLVWNIADTFNGLMAAPNLIALILLSGIIVSETKDFIAKRKSGELE